MGVSEMFWIAACAVVLLAMGQAASAANVWRVADQPDLSQQLEQAPVLKTEALGEPARGIIPYAPMLVPNPDGKTWDVLQCYYKKYDGPTWVFAVDLGTGKVKKLRFPDEVQYHMSGRELAFDGKLYMTGLAGWQRTVRGMYLTVYDPATDTLEDRGVIVPYAGEVRPLVVGTDQRLYGAGSFTDKVGLYIYDPKQGKVVKDFGPLGPAHSNGCWSRALGVDDQYAYIVSGDVPFYLIAVNLETGEEKILFETPPGKRMDIAPMIAGARAWVPQEDGSTKEYWLYHGQAIPKVDDNPPWPATASPWDKAPKEKPQIYAGQVDPDEEGNATLWYRLPEDERREAKGEEADRPKPRSPKLEPRTPRPEELGWKAVQLKDVNTYPYHISPLTLLPDGRLYSEGEYGYTGSFIFDPATGKDTGVGRISLCAPYTHIVHDGKVYFSGYWEGAIFCLEASRPWTLNKGGPPGHPAPDPESPVANPRRLGKLDKAARMTIGHSTAIGADGRIYFGGFGLRGYTGGSFGWYDPKTNEIDGFWKPLSGYVVQWIAPALKGRLIAISTITTSDELNNNQAPAEAKLFFYDVNERKIVREAVPVPGAGTTGLITEVAPGRLLGLTTQTTDPEHPAGGLLYGVDAATGDVLFRKPLPWPVGADPYWPHWVDPAYEYLDLVRGPDGFFWTFLKDVLVRIDPKEASIHVVGRIDPPGWPTFVGNDLYFSGAEQLRRIKNIVPKR